MRVVEDFEPIGIARLDTKKRITLGTLIKKIKVLLGTPINDFETFIGGDGDVLLRPRTAIPIRELLAHQDPKILKSIQEGIQDLKTGDKL